MVTGTPVAAVNFLVFSSQIVSSLLTNAVHRKSCSDAPFSGLNGDSAAKAVTGKAPASAAAPTPAADESKKSRRSGCFMNASFVAAGDTGQKSILPPFAIPAPLSRKARLSALRRAQGRRGGARLLRQAQDDGGQLEMTGLAFELEDPDDVSAGVVELEVSACGDRDVLCPVHLIGDRRRVRSADERYVHSFLPLRASKASNAPLPSPTNTSPPAVASAPPIIGWVPCTSRLSCPRLHVDRDEGPGLDAFGLFCVDPRAADVHDTRDAVRCGAR